MGTTGGGPGSNRYGPKGTGKQSQRSFRSRYGARESLSEPTTSLADEDYYSVAPDDLRLPGENDIAEFEFKHTGMERAVSRYISRRADFAFSAAYLEGNSFTLSEVQTLLEGVTPEGKPVDDVDQILDLTEASDHILGSVKSGEFNLRLDKADALNGILGRHEALDAGVQRTESRFNAGGRGASVNIMGETFHALSVPELHNAEKILAERTQKIAYPMLRAASYAAMMSYLQLYFDANKRTGRYMMDGELMAHGFDAAAIPASRSAEYQQSLIEMFRTGDASPYALFLLDVVQRGDPADK